MAKIGSCKLEKGYCYLIDNYQSKLKVNTKTDCRDGNKTVRHPLKKTVKSIHSNILFIICLKIKQSPMQAQAVNIGSLLLILIKRVNNGFS
jgi:hypothetical protein